MRNAIPYIRCVSFLSIIKTILHLLIWYLDNDPLADVTFQSSDGILFHLQRKYLEVATGAFPGAEFDTNGETTSLSEPAAVLAILFGFVHPKRYPDVEDLDFSLLADVAEAAEKYEAFAAIELCRLQMRFASRVCV